MKLAMTLEEGERLAGRVVDALRPVCERVEVAGSVRRRREEVGDVEVVAIPRVVPVHDIFGMVVGMTTYVNDVLGEFEPQVVKAGEHYKQMVIEGRTLDLFLCDRETWGVIFTIRTGNADFSKWLVTPRLHGGAMPSYMRCRDGRLWMGIGTGNVSALNTPEETDVFRALEIGWVDPSERKAGLWRR